VTANLWEPRWQDLDNSGERPSQFAFNSMAHSAYELANADQTRAAVV